MDGLSGAASLIAVISLAVQLGDSVHKFSKSLKSVRSAPKDLQGLIKNLDRLQCILAEVAQLAEQQRNHGSAPPPSTTLLTALEDCRTQYQALEAYASKVTASLQRSGLQKTWASWKIPARKENLQKLYGELIRSIDQLGTVLVLNTTRIQ
ncbi:MAG: hypothetical protein Q9225_001162 [Loekoesia sp. 1 TL-2023]